MLLLPIDETQAAAEGVAHLKIKAERHPWMEVRELTPAPPDAPAALESWCEAAGEALSRAQLAAHQGARPAHARVLQTSSTGTAAEAWALLPRDVRQALE